MRAQNFSILIVDDEEEMVSFMADYISKEGYQVLKAKNGHEMLKTVEREKVDLILLDVMMPVMDGLSALKEIRLTRKIPVIMVSAKSDENDRIQGLRTGADDYIVKPFSPKELLARVEAQLRRNYEFKEENWEDDVRYGRIDVKRSSRKTYVNGELVTLTRKEFELLIHFISHPEQVFSREQLLDRVWGINYTSGGHRTVDTHMKTLRFKLKEAGNYFRTVYGVGYVLEKVTDDESHT